jgi:hypothetical protein
MEMWSSLNMSNFGELRIKIKVGLNLYSSMVSHHEGLKHLPTLINYNFFKLSKILKNACMPRQNFERDY